MNKKIILLILICGLSLSISSSSLSKEEGDGLKVSGQVYYQGFSNVRVITPLVKLEGPLSTKRLTQNPINT